MSAQERKDAGTPKAPKGGLRGFFKRLLAEPTAPQLASGITQHQQGLENSAARIIAEVVEDKFIDPIFEQTLDRIDQLRAVRVVDEYFSPQVPTRNTEQDRWSTQQLEVETKIKIYLAGVDPVLTGGLRSMATRTWGTDGFRFSKRGPGVTPGTWISGVTIDGSRPITDIVLSDSQFPRDWHWRVTDACFSYNVGPDVMVNGEWEFYRVDIHFKDAKPYWLGYGDELSPSISGIGDLRKDSDSQVVNKLREILAMYYGRGPTHHSPHSGEG